MSKKKTSFSIALKEAKTRLAKATKDREKAQRLLSELNGEIPSLQKTIEALLNQINPNRVAFRDSRTGQQTTVSGKIVVPPIPPGLEKYVPPDTSGMGSIPHGSNVSIQDANEPELPEITGKEIA